MSRLLSRYSALLQRAPLSTKVPPPAPPARPVFFVRLLHGRRVCRLGSQATTSAALSGVGDLACQGVIEQRDHLDGRRLLTFTALGGFLVGPTLHGWYAWLHRAIPGSTAGSVLQRLALDQGVFAPIFTPSFMFAVRVLERPQEAPRALASVADDWWPAVTANWKLWIPAQLVNFAIVPLHFQVLFANGVALVWNTYLSHITHRS